MRWRAAGHFVLRENITDLFLSEMFDLHRLEICLKCSNDLISIANCFIAGWLKMPKAWTIPARGAEWLSRTTETVSRQGTIYRDDRYVCVKSTPENIDLSCAWRSEITARFQYVKRRYRYLRWHWPGNCRVKSTRHRTRQRLSRCRLSMSIWAEQGSIIRQEYCRRK